MPEPFITTLEELERDAPLLAKLWRDATDKEGRTFNEALTERADEIREAFREGGEIKFICYPPKRFKFQKKLKYPLLAGVRIFRERGEQKIGFYVCKNDTDAQGWQRARRDESFEHIEHLYVDAISFVFQ